MAKGKGPSSFRLWHWNGLPPDGPAMAWCDVEATEGEVSGGRREREASCVHKEGLIQ